MDGLLAWSLVAHLAGMVMWVGGLLAATMAMAQAAREAGSKRETSPSREAELASRMPPAAHAAYTRMTQRLLRALAHPGLILALAAGIALLFQMPQPVLHSAWLQAKLGLAAVLIALDWFITRLAGRMDAAPPSRGAAMRLHALVASVFLAILILVLVQP